MPKKTRKMKQRAALRRTAEPAAEVQEVEESAQQEDRPVVRMRPTFVTPRNSLADYDYSHIYGDLKRIALFASFFFVVLIVLSFVIK